MNHHHHVMDPFNAQVPAQMFDQMKINIASPGMAATRSRCANGTIGNGAPGFPRRCRQTCCSAITARGTETKEPFGRLKPTSRPNAEAATHRCR